MTNLLRNLKSPLHQDDLMNPPVFVQGQNGHRQGIPDVCVNASKDKTQKVFPDWFTNIKNISSSAEFNFPRVFVSLPGESSF